MGDRAKAAAEKHHLTRPQPAERAAETVCTVAIARLALDAVAFVPRLGGYRKLRSDAFAESTEVVRRPLALWLLGVLLLFVEATSEQVELRERHTS